MNAARHRSVRAPAGRGRTGATTSSRAGRLQRERGALSLEAVLVLPVLALLTLVLLGTVTILRDVLLLHEAARAGARVAATTADNATVETVVRAAAPELDGLRLSITPPARTSGDVVTVTTRVGRSLGPTTFRLRATAHARVEPTMGAHGEGAHPWWQPDPLRRPGPRRPWTSDGWPP